MGCCGCLVIIAGDRRADTPSIENLAGKAGDEDKCGRGEGDPGIKQAG